MKLKLKKINDVDEMRLQQQHHQQQRNSSFDVLNHLQRGGGEAENSRDGGGEVTDPGKREDKSIPLPRQNLRRCFAHG